jgi:hypothetical protein
MFNQTIKTTISYNLLIQSFESFYDFYSGIMHVNGNKLLTLGAAIVPPASVITANLNECMIHENTAYYGSYYGIVYPIILKFVSNEYPDKTKVFNNFEFDSQVLDNSLADVYNETINYIKVDNSYQTSGTITLTVGENIQRFLRTWRLHIPRDSGSESSKMRDKYISAELTYTNDGYKRFYLYDIITKFYVNI